MPTKKKPRVRSAKSPATVPPDAVTLPGEVLVMRTCAADMTAHGRFKWPTSGEVAAPDWSPVAECGQGLHGLLWGAGNASLLSWAEDAKWLVVAVPRDSVVDLAGKVKFPRGRVVFVGGRVEAAKLIGQYAPACTPIVSGTATAGYSGTATAGDSGTATAGYSGTATAGDSGTISILYWDPKREKYRRAIGEVGEDGIEPNTAYVVDGGKLVKKAKP